MDLLEAYKNFIKNENLFIPGEPLLLAVSGGLDSVVLCELTHRAGHPFILAHANFQLRGEESTRDEEFVRDLAKKYNRPLLVKKFDTEQYAHDQKISIQVAARELRYAWFREIIASHPAVQSDPPLPDSIAGIPNLTAPASDRSLPGPISASSSPRRIVTAHHLDDNIETLLMNFFKGTGIAGLRAMLPLQGDLARPLLFAGKETLREFARTHQLSWVEDSSNDSEKYTRNYFRRQVIPLVQQIYPAAISNLEDNTYRFRDIETLYRQSIDRHLQQLLEYKGAEVHIPALKLRRAVPLHTIVYEIIAAYGFSPQQVGTLIGLLDSDTGKYLLSSTHRILKNRNWLIIAPLPPARANNILIESAADRPIFADRQLTFKILPFQPELANGQSLGPVTSHNASEQTRNPKPETRNPKPETRNPKPETSCLLDAEAIQFPLLLRKWQHGDYFYPLGMPKKKKIARFLIDNRLSLADKEKVWVIEMNKKIIWVVGMRIDHRFRLTPQTRQILKIEAGLA